MNKTILVTGGCGYIGSHTIIDLLNHEFEVICIDNNSNSSPNVIDRIQQITNKKISFFQTDISDRKAFQKVIASLPQIEGIIHFAAYKSVGESVEKPLSYYDNNLLGLLNVLQIMQINNIPNLIFSSSCSVYGDVSELPVVEETRMQEAESPYARTKQIGEAMIGDFVRANNHKNTVLLRYFNPAGAHESGLIGEDPINKASNLIPVITETAIGKRKKLTVFGDDYNTRDGSCIRDYIHVMDLANAHTKCLTYLLEGKSHKDCEVFNVGIGQGVTVLEAIHAFEKVNKVQLNYEIGPRRIGDIVAIYANYEKAASVIGWHPTRTIDDIMKTAWMWEKTRSEQTVDI